VVGRLSLSASCSRIAFGFAACPLGESVVPSMILLTITRVSNSLGHLDTFLGIAIEATIKLALRAVPTSDVCSSGRVV
jgi:hypothetical protein